MKSLDFRFSAWGIDAFGGGGPVQQVIAAFAAFAGERESFDYSS
jgi:hypothetical protein